MFPLDRRQFIQSTGALAAGVFGSQTVQTALQAEENKSTSSGQLQIAPFRFDVTTPMGHGLCGGWITPAQAVDDSLEAIGYVLLGAGKPIVVCAVDWTGLLNEAHVAWREALAEAAGTTPERVAVQCVHQHNAPMACIEAEKIVAAQGDLPHLLDLEFFDRCLESGRKAVKQAIPQAVPLTHIATGEATVTGVASNRSLYGLNGKVVSQRGSSSRVPFHHHYPDGLIDPQLKTVAFYNGDKKVVSCHYYACHPMSYYGDGRISSDFCGLARKQRQAEEPDCTHIYFNGCGGNIGAGKYNNGSKEMRPVLVERMHAGMVKSEEALKPVEIQSVKWVTQEIMPEPQPIYDADKILKDIENKSLRVVSRNRPAYTWAWLKRCEKKIPLVISALHINQATSLHLPGESFVEYQLRAQVGAPERFVACAAYGDNGTWYIPTREAFPKGGYEVSVSWCGPEIDELLSGGIQTLLGQA